MKYLLKMSSKPCVYQIISNAYISDNGYKPEVDIHGSEHYERKSLLQ